MKRFFKKVKKLPHRLSKKIASLSGTKALLLAALCMGIIVPITVYGWPGTSHYTIYPSMSYTPVATGGYTTVSYSAYWNISADYCSLSYTQTPTSGHISGESCYNYAAKGGGRIPAHTSCSATVYSPAGSFYVGPMNGATSYTLSCTNTGGWNDGDGSTAVTIYPTAPTRTTLNYFYASPTSIARNTNATLYYSGNPGTRGIGLYLGGYGYLSGWSGKIARGPLATTTTYSIYTEDSYYGQVGPWTAKVTPVDPAGPCNDILSATTVPNGCVNPVPAPGTCIPAGGSYSAASNTCSCPAGKHLDGASCVKDPLCANGLNDSYAPSCACPAHQYQPGGVSWCVPLPVCANGLDEAYSPSCTCPVGKVQVQGGSTCVQKGVINSMTVSPSSRVRKGNTGTVSWDTASMASCVLKGPADGVIGTLSTQLSGSYSAAIINQSVFTLTCLDLSGASYSSTATINLIPEVIEQ